MMALPMLLRRCFASGLHAVVALGTTSRCDIGVSV